MQFQHDPHGKVLGKCHELAHLLCTLMQYLQLYQGAAHQFLQQLQAAAPICHGCTSLWFVWVLLQEQGSYAAARYSGLHPKLC